MEFVIIISRKLVKENYLFLLEYHLFRRVTFLRFVTFLFISSMNFRQNAYW